MKNIPTPYSPGGGSSNPASFEAYMNIKEKP